MRGLKSLIALGAFAGAIVWPMGASSVLASVKDSGTPSDTIIQVGPGAGDSTTSGACSTAISKCTAAILKLINHDRTQAGLPNLTLTPTQSVGGPACVGSYGHSIAMAKSGAIWHNNPQFPRASFPTSICVHFLHAGENVGESSTGNAKTDLKELETLMMSEPHNQQVCASTLNHACNILNPQFHQVGIGVYYSHGATWLTEDFTN